MVRIALFPFVLASMAVAAPTNNNERDDTPGFASKTVIFDRAAPEAEGNNGFESKVLLFERDNEGVPADNEVAKGMLATWNAWRSKLGRPPLSWNYGMTLNAQYWANQCNWESEKYRVNEDVGYGITNSHLYVWNNKKNESDASTRMTLRNEVNRYMATGKNYNWDNPIDPLADNTVARDFIGIAWLSTTEIGCAWNYCPGELKPPKPGYRDTLLLFCGYNGRSYTEYHEAEYAENMKPPPETVDYDAWY